MECCGILGCRKNIRHLPSCRWAAQLGNDLDASAVFAVAVLLLFMLIFKDEKIELKEE